MKTLKKLVLVSVISVSMASSVFAAWWNPFSWKVFSKKSNQVAVQQNVATSTPQEEFLVCNGSKYRKCSEGESFNCPVNGGDAFCEKKSDKENEIKTPLSVTSAKQKAEESLPKSVDNGLVKNNTVNNTAAKQIASTKASVEKNDYQSRAINLYTLLIDLVDSKIEKVRLNKKFCDDAREIWSNELIKNETFLQSFPGDPYLVRDGKIYRAQIADIDTHQRYEQNIEDILVDYKRKLQNRVEQLRSAKVTAADMQQILLVLESAKIDLEAASNKSEENFKSFYDFNKQLVVKMDALHAAESAKRSYETKAIEQQNEEILRLKESINRNVQGAIDAYNNSKSINCTSRATGIQGQYEISCN
jgi:hypothetical protein